MRIPWEIERAFPGIPFFLRLFYFPLMDSKNKPVLQLLHGVPTLPGAFTSK